MTIDDSGPNLSARASRYLEVRAGSRFSWRLTLVPRRVCLSGAGQEVFGEEVVFAVDGLADLESRRFDHRLQKPRIGRVFIPHVFFGVLSSPFGLVSSEGCAPGLDAGLGLVDAEGEHNVGQAQEAAGGEYPAGFGELSSPPERQRQP